MPRDGNNVYTLPEAPFQSNTVAQPAPINNNLTDIASALTASFTRGETTAFTRTLLDDADAAAARTTLGATATGSAVFAAADAAAGRAALGGTATGGAVFTAADPAAARLAAGITGTVIDRRYAEYTAYAGFTAVIPGDDTIPQNTEGTEILSVTLTPKSVTSRVLLMATVGGTHDTLNGATIAALFSSASANALAASYGSQFAAALIQSWPVVHEYVPGVTTPLTFSLRIGPTSGTFRTNGGNASRFLGGAMRCTLHVLEIA